MNRIELDEALKSLSGTSTGTDGLIWITDDADNLTQRPYNFVEVRAGRYEIWRPGDRGKYIMSLTRRCSRGHSRRPSIGCIPTV